MNEKIDIAAVNIGLVFGAAVHARGYVQLPETVDDLRHMRVARRWTMKLHRGRDRTERKIDIRIKIVGL
jgi:hypothetical protein